MSFMQHTKCRVCDSTRLTKYIDLGFLPLSNNLCNDKNEEPDRYPLRVMLCEDCGLSQLSGVVDPDVLFSHYVYRSSINQGYVNHCRQMAKDLKKEYNLTADSFHIDIAGNDGALLKQFKEEIGYRLCLNIDPARNLFKHNEDQGVRMYMTFWGIPAAEHLIKTSWPRADLITATNVFAHVDNVKEFIQAVTMVMKPSGTLVLEFPYIIDFIWNNEFDTIYFEHLSYFSIRPLIQLVKGFGLNVEKVEKKDIHGGSVRVHIGYGDQQESVQTFILQNEYKLIKDDYMKFASKAKRTIDDFMGNLIRLKSKGKKIAAFAASAKGNTLLNCASINDYVIDYIIDETPEKIGKYSPGTYIPIVGMENIGKPDYIVILSWNFADEIMAKCKNAGYTGDFIIPIPEFKIIEQKVKLKQSA
jgi:hypothetical protein